MSIRIAFVGAGRVIEHHCALLKQIPEIEVVAVSDLREDRGKPIAELTNTPWYQDYHEMFASHPEIDLVVIATPSGMHYEHAIDILDRYGTHLLIEKPTFMRPEHMRETYDLAAKRNAHIFPVYQNRFNKAVRRVKEAVTSGELGAIRMASVRLRWCRPQRYYDRDLWRGTWSHDGGAMTNQGIHYLDLLRYLGGEIQRVNAVIATLGVDIEVEDTAAATFEFVNGGFGVIEITTAARPDDFEASVSLVGDKGMAVLSGLATNEIVVFSPNPEVCSTHSAEIPNAYGVGHRDTYSCVAQDLAGEASYPIDFNDTMNTLLLLHALYRSSEVGNWVNVGENTTSESFGQDDENISKLYRSPVNS